MGLQIGSTSLLTQLWGVNDGLALDRCPDRGVLACAPKSAPALDSLEGWGLTVPTAAALGRAGRAKREADGEVFIGVNLDWRSVRALALNARFGRPALVPVQLPPFPLTTRAVAVFGDWVRQGLGTSGVSG